MIYHGEVELAPDNEMEDLDPWLDPDEEDRLRLLREERELARWEVEHVPTDRERSRSSKKFREYLGYRLWDRRSGMLRSNGPCYRRRKPTSGTLFKGRRGANKRAQANEHRRASGFARP